VGQKRVQKSARKSAISKHLVVQRAQGKPVGQNLGKAPGAGTERRNVWLLVLVWLRPCRAVVAVLT
jgi:hypothetical protein